MAITPQHEKGEHTEADLEHAYTKAREIGLFLVEKYARAALHEHPEYTEFIMGMGTWGFLRTTDIDAGYEQEVSLPLLDLMEKREVELNLASEPMRFTATGPVRREW